MRAVVKTVLCAAVLGLAGFGAYRLLGGGGGGEGLGIFRDTLLARAIPAAARAIGEAAPVKLYVLPFRGDGGGVVRARLEREIRREGRARVIERATLAEELRDRAPGILAPLVERVLGGDPDRPLARDEAIAFARGAGLDAVVVGDVRAFEDGDRRARIDATFEAIGAETGDSLISGETLAEIRKSWTDPVYLRARISSVPLAWRILGWILVALALPWILWAPARRVLERESNVRNAALFAAVTFADAAILWVILGLPGTAAGAIAVGILGLGLAGTYSYLALSEIDELRR
ncbi:MAG: hypothetical protein JXP34_03800 [Planctomycetes bacterium]|nr:hypothetical protein [Planctomycetota bacterium]